MSFGWTSTRTGLHRVTSDNHTARTSRPTRTGARCAHLVWHDAEPRRREAAALLAHRVLPRSKLSDLHDLRRRAEQVAPDFTTRGVETIAISSDTEARASDAQMKWGFSQLTVGHSLTIGTARTWGLYISSGRGVTSTGVDDPRHPRPLG